MKIVIYYALVQAMLGAFDTLYYHEYKLQLPKSGLAKLELKLHALRDFAYSLIFITFAWFEWHGVLAALFASVVAGEIFITIWDFVEEDLTRKLPVGERAMHTIMAIVYGGLLANLLPLLFQWWGQPTGILSTNYGIFSWVLTLFSIAVFGSGIRDLTASLSLPSSGRKD